MRPAPRESIGVWRIKGPRIHNLKYYVHTPDQVVHRPRIGMEPVAHMAYKTAVLAYGWFSLLNHPWLTCRPALHITSPQRKTVKCNGTRIRCQRRYQARPPVRSFRNPGNRNREVCCSPSAAPTQSGTLHRHCGDVHFCHGRQCSSLPVPTSFHLLTFQ